MTINMAPTTSTAYTANSTALNGLTTSSASTQSSSELTDEEKLYDADGDGTLSIEEQAAYLQAQETKKTLESSKSTKSSESASITISEEGLKMQAQDPAKSSPPDVNEMSDDELKNMLNDMKSQNNKLPKDLNEYSDTDINSLSSDDLDNIREIMTKAQEERKEKMDLLNANNQQNPMSHAISAYKKFSTENMLSSVI